MKSIYQEAKNMEIESSCHSSALVVQAVNSRRTVIYKDGTYLTSEVESNLPKPFSLSQMSQTSNR